MFPGRIDSRRSPCLSSSRLYPCCDPLTGTTVNYLRNTLNVTKLAVTGYCFGGRYSFRFVDAARTVKADVAFAAHPSAWEDGEVSAIGAATAVATAGKLCPPHLYLAKVRGSPGFGFSSFRLR